MATSTAPNRTVDRRLGTSPSPTSQLDGDKLLPLPAEPQRAAVDRRQRTSAPGARHFVRHLIEMVLAMMIGMMALGALDRGILAIAGTSVSHVRASAPELGALAMALNMTVGMTAWMLHRGHSWVMCAEMAGAMFVPAIAALVLLWCGVIHSGSVVGVEHAPMLPAMVAVMLLRRTEYSQPVHAHAPSAMGMGAR